MHVILIKMTHLDSNNFHSLITTSTKTFLKYLERLYKLRVKMWRRGMWWWSEVRNIPTYYNNDMMQIGIFDFLGVSSNFFNLMQSEGIVLLFLAILGWCGITWILENHKVVCHAKGQDDMDPYYIYCNYPCIKNPHIFHTHTTNLVDNIIEFTYRG